MVNLLSKIMDDYEVMEPSDVGHMTIDYDSKDDLKIRRFRWDPEEVSCMLHLIKENKFVTRYSANKMANFLSSMLAKKGWNRTQRQVHIKISTLRKNYLNYERTKLTDGSSKECPFYKELREIYRDALNSANGIDIDDYDSNSQEETSIKFPNDPIDWSKEEVQKMLNTIKSMKLKNELTLTFFSPAAVRMITEAMHQTGFDRSTEQVKNALVNLRSMYIDYKIGCDNNENPTECLFFPCLDFFWGREFKKCRSKEKKKTKNDDFWSTEETIMLLTIIQDLNITNEAYENTEKAAEELMHSLSESNFIRSKVQIMDKLEQLKVHFISVHEKCAQGDALKRFPFYNLYKKLFEKHFIIERKDKSIKSNYFKNQSPESDNEKKLKISQRTVWSKEEKKLLLKAVRELTCESNFNDSLEDEKLKKLIKTFREEGYFKTAEQIKNELTQLKESYLKCNLEESSEKDVFECPFYNELHDIFQTPVSDERYEFIQNVLSENVDSNSSKFSDHSYNKFKSASGNFEKNDKVTVIPNNNTWFPVESIIEEEVMTSNNVNDETSLSIEQRMVEEALRSILPEESDTKIEKNESIAPIPGVKDIIVENNKKLAISSSLIIGQDKKTNEEAKITEDSLKINQERTSEEIIEEFRSLNEEDDMPPTKKIRIIDDEKFTKKILLRPLESSPSISHLSNVANTKFVRLMIANDQSNSSKVNQITAHIEPMNVNTTSSVSSGTSSPVERLDTLKLAADKALLKDFETQSAKNTVASNGNDLKNLIPDAISGAIKEAAQNMMKNDELLQQKHHTWMEKQFELHRKYEEKQRNLLVNELKELKSVISSFINNTAHLNEKPK